MSSAVHTSLPHAVERACARIAPAWPLDRSIAVNPYWGFVEQPIEDAAAALGELGGTRLTMPRAWYRARFQAGAFTARHVRAALELTGARRTADEVLTALATDEEPLRARPLVTDLVDADRDLAHHESWSVYVTRELGQACAATFDEGQARWTPDRSGGLFGLWRTLAERDAGPRLLMGLRGFRAEVARLPARPAEALAAAVDGLELPEEACEAYFTALLMSMHGWASHCAFRRWEARLAGRDDDSLVHLLATRAAWELVLLRTVGAPGLEARWERARREWTAPLHAPRTAERDDWVLQRALELAHQERIAGALVGPRGAPEGAPSAHAVFCIDVRSEVLRRALEAADPSIRTLGFAGFFGLPIAYAPASGSARPQLPGLLAPALLARDGGSTAAAAAERSRAALARSAAWKELAATPASAFSFVEVAGMAFGSALVRDALGRGGGTGDVLRAGVDPASRPELAGRVDGTALDAAARAELAAGILRAMGLTRGFGRLLVLVGHGSSTTNNPQAAGLHCGACGGQTGEVNARLLAGILGDPDVRAELARLGIELPADTCVVAGLHDTTTDEVTLFDLERVPAGHRDELELFRLRLAEAGARARAERAPALGLASLAGTELLAALRRRASDWSEVRPEWGLARNAAFVVAPRERTRGVDLGGRAFLHDYRWSEDAGFAVLETILTAPMVVTHWINMQYFASTVDNARYGSGDKVLHNVVGGRIGVLEGAGGDLRIGLALQSVHDGRDWHHEPLRLSVFVEAPAAGIDGVLARHERVRRLVANGWLFLFRIEPRDGTIHRRDAAGWTPVAGG